MKENQWDSAVEYFGSRFRKCDLQMQTPADIPHWMGEDLNVAEDPVRAAETYIRKCYEEKLELIAITDHNFFSKNFIPHLQGAASRLADEFGYSLVVFPGFEITANVGKGLHLLGIFPPDRDLDDIDHVLTECGVSRPRQKPNGTHIPSTKNLDDILKVIQTRDDQGALQGIVILPHSQSDSGIFDNDRIAEWLQSAEFTNPNLYALEVPKSPSEMSEGWQRLFGGGEECTPEWRRKRPIACILSSDTKALADTTNTANIIGSKYTWMKISEPSLEALRQCFLDNQSRIRLSDTCPDNPEAQYTYPRVHSLNIKGTAFLADQKIAFSPNLNTLIGGRGTGKSTVLEYLRIGLERSSEIDTENSGELRKDFEKFKSTLPPTSELVVEYDKGPDFDGIFKISHTVGTSLVVGEEVGSIPDFFPLQIFSRSQIEAMANDPAKQRLVLDDPIAAELNVLRSREREAVGKISELNSKIAAASELENERSSLIAAIRNHKGKIKSIEKHLGPLKGWLEWKAAKASLELADYKASEIFDEIDALLSDEKFSLARYESDDAEILAVNDEIEKVASLIDSFIKTLQERVKNDKASLISLREETSRIDWLKKYDGVEKAQSAAIAELQENGVDPDEYDNLIQARDSLEERLKKLIDILAEISAGRQSVEKILDDELLPVWNEQIELRKTIADLFNRNVPKTKNGEPTVRTEVVPYGDYSDFKKTMQPYLVDRRSVSEDDWDAVMRSIQSVAKERKIPPSFVLKEWIELANIDGEITGFPSDRVSRSKILTIASWISETQLNDILAKRTLDSVSVTLHRRIDGKLIGDLVGRKLSAGQRATTILSLLLAHGTNPIVIDQPEDDLDNEFVYEQLVPMLRKAKERRQIILATHNANIPVNGDAELILPLAIENEAGAQKKIDGVLALGSLDKPPVQEAVELILEGSVEAFKKRQERYGI